VPHPFRFGVQLATMPGDQFEGRVRRIEALGYSTVFWPDHWGAQYEPVAALAAAAAITTKLNVGSLVYGVDYRHPIVLAKAAATIQLLSNGRHEFGIGAGWMRTDYDQAGMAYDKPSLRIERLDEALTLIRSMWTQPKTSLAGRHYTVTDAPRAVEPAPARPPRILVGAGGRKALTVAGRHADIVGINPSLPEGRILPTTAADLAPERVREKIGWVREAAEAAGRDVAAIELNSLVFVTAVMDDPAPIRAAVSKQTGMSVAEVAECASFLTGPATEICDRLQKRREETGISYVVIQGGDPATIERFAEAVVAPLAGR
jgi:probable F420-dependent oxidoreductase